MLNFKAKDIMTRDVISIKKSERVERAMVLMAENNISGLPVVDNDGKLIGMVTENDLLLKDQIPVPYPRMALFGLFVVPDDLLQESYRKARGVLVEDAMTKKVISFTEDSVVSTIARAMVENKINRVPITRDGKVVGIISRADIIKAMAAQNGWTDDDDDTETETKRERIEL